MTINPHARNGGFTIIEVVLFIAVFTTSIVLIFATVNYSALGLKNAQLKIMASHASEELSEWFTYQKDGSGYASILNKSTVGGTSYCFNTLSASWPVSGVCSTYGLNNIYSRQATVTRSADGSQVTIDISTSWNSLGTVRSSDIIMLFTNR